MLDFTLNLMRSHELTPSFPKQQEIARKLKKTNSSLKTWVYVIHRLRVKGNWAYLTEEYSRPGAKIITIFRISWKYFNWIIMKTLLKHLFYFEQLNHVLFFKVLF